MIFDKEYDTSLFYIAKAKNKNRKELLEFIKEIPDELIEKIRIEIERAKAKEPESDDDNFYLSVSEKDPDVVFSFDVDRMDYCLTILKERQDGKKISREFELMLYPLDLENLKEFSSEEYLGSVSKDNKFSYISDDIQEIDVEESEYYIHHFPIGFFVSHNKELLGGKYEMVLYRPVNIKRVPTNIEKNNVLQRRFRRG